MKTQPLPLMPRLALAGIVSPRVAPTISKELMDTDQANDSFSARNEAHNNQESVLATNSNQDETDSVVSFESMGTIESFAPDRYSFVPNQVDILIFSEDNERLMQEDAVETVLMQHTEPTKTVSHDFHGATSDSHFISDSESETGSRTGGPSQSLAALYTTPVHIAIAQGTALSVLKLIVQTGPSVLLKRDGPHGLTPLALSLETNPRDKQLHRYLLETQPKAARLASSYGQKLPLHIACQQQVDIQVFMALIQANPSALYHSNSKGLTPLAIACNQPESSLFRQQVLQLLR
ncbi:expressed unknown protein [Seminavis robusta]|uniref:Uncharacterized protein n=1 Tax=Seminavis robusta TaxID=568900 RepID=A0A9N8DTD2_9STRA|nr:expressed unknown protein [Seminavis robusta]|eukprot:Sro356_g125340.1 n/a (292) ;mRNA; r:33617-34492